jgi:chromosome segregation ATPase
MFGSEAERIERKIKRLNAIRAEYEDDLADLKKRLRDDKISRERYEHLRDLTQMRVDRLVSQIKELRQKKERLNS